MVSGSVDIVKYLANMRHRAYLKVRNRYAIIPPADLRVIQALANWKHLSHFSDSSLATESTSTAAGAAQSCIDEYQDPGQYAGGFV